MLPVKKIYIDTRFKTTDSVSNSSFKIQLPRSYHFPKNTAFLLKILFVHMHGTASKQVLMTLYTW